MSRNPNGYANTNSGDWPLYTYPERAHIVLDFVNKSTGVAHRADYCHFWEQYVPILLEEFGRRSFLPSLKHLLHFRTLCHSWAFFHFTKRKILQFLEKTFNMFTLSLSSPSSPSY